MMRTVDRCSQCSAMKDKQSVEDVYSVKLVAMRRLHFSVSLISDAVASRWCLLDVRILTNAGQVLHI